MPNLFINILFLKKKKKVEMVYNYIMFDICWHYFNHLVYLKEKKKEKKKKKI